MTIPFAGLVSQGVWANPIYANVNNFVSPIIPKAGRLKTDLGFTPSVYDEIQTEEGGTPHSYIYLGSNNWYGGEPVIGLGQGFIVLTGTNNVWLQTNQACSGTFEFNPAWTNNLDSFDTNLSGIDASPAIGPNGIVLLPTRDNILWALNARGGLVLWSNADFVDVGDEITSSPLVSADQSTVYFGTASGFLVAETNLAGQGITEWFSFLAAGVFSSPALASNGDILVGTDDSISGNATGVWECFTNGMVDTNFSTSATNIQDVDGSPSIGADSTVYFMSEAPVPYASNPGIPLHFMALSTNGTVTWAFPLTTDQDTPVDFSPAIGSNGVVYGTGLGQYLYAINSDGSPKWIFDIGSADSFTVGSPTIGPGGMIVVGSTHHLYAVTNGALKFAFPPFDSGTTIAFQSSPAIDANGNVYVGGMDGNFYEISNNGGLIAAIPAPAPIVSSPVISSNSATNLVIYASTDGSVFAQEIPTGLATNCDWPMFRRTPSHWARQDSGPTLAHASGAPFPFTSGTALDSSGDLQFSVVGPSGTNWEVFHSTDYQTWSDTGMAAAMNPGPGPQLGTFSTNVGADTKGFYFMDSNGVCSKAVGFVESTLPAGTNLFGVPLYQIDPAIVESVAPNTLFTLLSPGVYPGVEVDLWNGHKFNVYTNDGNNWFLDGTNNNDGLLLPGQGARVITTLSISITNIGLVRDGAELNGTNYVTNYITGQTNYLSSILPLSGGVTSVLGFPASPGDQITRWNNGTTQSTFTYTNGGSGTN